MTQKCPLSKPEWVNFLNEKVSQRIDFMWSRREYDIQRIILLVSIISIATMVLITAVNILDFSDYMSFGLIIIILILYFGFIFREKKIMDKNYSEYADKPIETLSHHNNIIKKILKDEYKTSDEIWIAWDEAEKKINELKNMVNS